MFAIPLYNNAQSLLPRLCGIGGHIWCVDLWAREMARVYTPRGVDLKVDPVNRVCCSVPARQKVNSDGLVVIEICVTIWRNLEKAGDIRPTHTPIAKPAPCSNTLPSAV